jgi:hypothetical protein
VPSWNELLSAFNGLKTDQAKTAWLSAQQKHWLATIGTLRQDRHVLLYGSAFLQKPMVPAAVLQITHEDLHGFMGVFHGMDWDKGLTVLLHTPGGVTNATETLVAYVRSKFSDVEVIVPAIAMSAGTMIALSGQRIVMGRQSQLGPIDAQLPVGGRYVSARAIVDQFERAQEDIVGPNGDIQNAHVWAPILGSLGPALLQEAQNALAYGEDMVAKWLTAYMFKGRRGAKSLGQAAAKYFNDAGVHKSHGRRIDRDEARTQKIVIEDLEDDQDLQEAVLSAYHLMTIIFEHSPAAKLVCSDHGGTWVKNLAVQQAPKP